MHKSIPFLIYFLHTCRRGNYENYHAWRGEADAGEYEDVKYYCNAAKLEEVREHEYILTPGRYVGIEDLEEDRDPFDEKMQRLTSDLAEKFDKLRHLEEEIRQRLGAIGYEF